MNRRTFVKSAVIAGAGTLAFRNRAWAFAQSPTNIRKFVTSLPGLGSSAKNEIGQYIPVASRNSAMFAGQMTDTYNLGVATFSERMHPDLPGKTDFLGYFDMSTYDQKYLGGAIVATKERPVLLNVANKTPNRAIIPVDPTMMAGPNGLMVGDLPLNRIANHLHGGLSPWFSDGTPYQWYTPSGLCGPSFMNVPGTTPPPGTATYYYPNQQSSRLAWYHDHAMGITRTNAYLGIAAPYIIVDEFEMSLVSSGLLPDLVGIPLVIQDKGFVPTNIGKQDPTWKWGNPGDLWYPHIYEPNVEISGSDNVKGRWDWGPTADSPAQGTMPLPSPACEIPEAFFDTILINGGLYPKLSVPPKRVRFRILNASQARFFHLNLYAESAFNTGEANLSAPGPVMYQFGTEGGFLPAVVVHSNKIALTPDAEYCENPDGPFNVMLAPAERADLVIDFNGVPAGTSFILYNDAVTPFPCGDSRNDYYTGNPDQTAYGGAPSTRLGLGPNTRTLMKIVVASGTSDTLSTPTWREQMNRALSNNYGASQPALLYNSGNPGKSGPLPYNGAVNRIVTLNEDFDEYGRLIQTIGTSTSKSINNQGLPTWGMGYMAEATETPVAGAVEVWQIMNLTGDVHPMHFHLVNVQLIQRQAFTGDPGDFSLAGDPLPPHPNETGWKETVRCNPGEITTVIMQFTLPTLPHAMGDPISPRTGGHEYVWHCHILEHEEHDMMRPLIVS
jgi:spore coat protein A, manganese oxidase